MIRYIAAILFLAACGSDASAAPLAPALAQSPTEALQQDAGQYALQRQVARAEALRRLRAQQASVRATQGIAEEFADRLAGIAMEHSPEYRIVVLLTGDEPVAKRIAGRGTNRVPIIFRTGARATRRQAVAALRRHLIEVRQQLPGARGAGYDQRAGEVVLLVRSEHARRFGIAAIRQRAEQVAGVPVRIEINDLPETNLAVEGGGYVAGLGADGRRSRCTTGFVVQHGERRGVATAAHCPDQLNYRTLDGRTLPLPFAGQWGHAYQDVQINTSAEAKSPHFFADRRTGSIRPVHSWRNLAGIRAGDFVCHWGESTYYSCGEVQLTDYAPPGLLCGGPCTPTWVTVAGPACAPGDSGGPVFIGTIAIGILKGANRTPAGDCNFYYFMSTDFLPRGWSLRYSK